MIKLRIPIKYHNQNCKIESHGDWIDLKSAEKVSFSKVWDFKIISLGVSMKLPKYYQANLIPRSSTFKKFGLIQSNHMGVIDGPTKTSPGYCGNDDIWGFAAISGRRTTINEGDRICQFEIRPTMRAPWWVKLKWLFVSNIIFVEVDKLDTENRGGFGSTNQ